MECLRNQADERRCLKETPCFLSLSLFVDIPGTLIVSVLPAFPVPPLAGCRDMRNDTLLAPTDCVVTPEPGDMG